MKTRRSFLKTTCAAVATLPFCAKASARRNLYQEQNTTAGEWLRKNMIWLEEWMHSQQKLTPPATPMQEFKEAITIANFNDQRLIPFNNPKDAAKSRHLDETISNSLGRMKNRIFFALVNNCGPQDGRNSVEGFIHQRGRLPTPMDKVVIHVTECLRYEEWPYEVDYYGHFLCGVARLEILT